VVWEWRDGKRLFLVSAEDFDKLEKLQRLDLPGNNLSE
jgi:hypothetical protein